jgi:hypothetical protein
VFAKITIHWHNSKLVPIKDVDYCIMDVTFEIWHWGVDLGKRVANLHETSFTPQTHISK